MSRQRPHSWRVPADVERTNSQAIGRGLTRGPGKGGGGAFLNTPGERHAASLTCADRSTGRADLIDLLDALGLAP